MTKNEVEKLFNLLTSYFSGAKQLNENLANTKLAWDIALEPYRWEDVREAVISYARVNKFFPRVADITELFPKGSVKKQKDSALQREIDTQIRLDIDALFAEDKK